ATAAHATLASFLNKKLVNEEEAITAVLISSAAMRTRTLFQYYLPIAVPALGFMLAAKYIAFSFIGAIVTVMIGFFYGRLRVVNEGERVNANFENKLNGEVTNKPLQGLRGRGAEPHKSKKEAIKKSFADALKLLKKVSLRLGITIIVLMILMHLGAFEALEKHIAPVLHQVGLSPQSIIVISMQIASPSAGMVMAGEMFRNGLFTSKEVLLTLFIGLLLFVSIMDFPKNIFPIFTSIYGVKFASKLVTIELSIFIGTTLFIIIMIYFLLS
ncbi:MAG: hypothetical protein QMD22_04980, partial [archaeon]|nr:hypothetical protein [archaeon]